MRAARFILLFALIQPAFAAEPTLSGKLGEWIDIGDAVQELSSDSSEILSSTRSLRNEDHHVFIKVEEAKPRK